MWKEADLKKGGGDCLPSGAMVTSSPWLLPRAMSRYMALQQPGSVLMSMASVIAEGPVSDFLGSGQSPESSLRAMLSMDPG